MDGIGAWLGQIAGLLDQDPALALEVIRNQRLIKGYSETHARGSRHFDQLMQALPVLRSRAGSASVMRDLREAALADESGERLATLLAAQRLAPAAEPSATQAGSSSQVAGLRT